MPNAYEPAWTGEDRAAPKAQARVSSVDREDRVQVEVTVNHQGNVTAAKANHRSKPVLTNLRTLTPMPSGVS